MLGAVMLLGAVILLARPLTLHADGEPSCHAPSTGAGEHR
jgi:hypothetical protein